MKEFFDYGIGTLTVGKILSAIVLLLICLVVAKILNKLIANVLAKTSVDISLRAFLCAAIKILLWFVTILIVADSIGIPVSSLLAVFSIAGLAASLAMQNTLSNFASGILILVTHPFHVGDYIECGTVSGTVKSISLVHTQLDTVDNRLIYIPNSEVSASKVINFSSESTRRVELKVSAAYDSPIDQVKAALRAAADATPDVLLDQEIFITVSAYQDSSIQYLIRVWCKNAAYWDVYYALLEEIKRQFDLYGVEMSYPHLNVHMEAGRK